MTQRTYSYREFEITLEIEPEVPFRPGAVFVLPTHYICNIQMRSVSLQCELDPVRLTKVHGRPFVYEADAIIAGHRAAEDVIDEVIALTSGH
jgi:hypothetical protein